MARAADFFFFIGYERHNLSEKKSGVRLVVELRRFLSVFIGYAALVNPVLSKPGAH